MRRNKWVHFMLSVIIDYCTITHFRQNIDHSHQTQQWPIWSTIYPNWTRTLLDSGFMKKTAWNLRVALQNIRPYDRSYFRDHGGEKSCVNKTILCPGHSVAMVGVGSLNSLLKTVAFWLYLRTLPFQLRWKLEKNPWKIRPFWRMGCNS